MAQAGFADALMSDTALAAAYLRRLGFTEDRAAEMAASQPLAAAPPSFKDTVSELVRRHVLHVPNENLELCGPQPAPLQDRLCRLSDVREVVRKLAFGCTGGICFDICPAFTWLLRHLGAKASLALAWEATEAGYAPCAKHLVVVVDNSGQGQFLLDPGSTEPSRVAVGLSMGETHDGLSTYEVVPAGEAEPAGYSSVLRRRRSPNTLPALPEPNALAAEAEDSKEQRWATVCAFRADDDLAFDAEEVKQALAAALAAAAGRLLYLALPLGHVVLTEQQLRRVESGNVAEEVSVDNEEVWSECAGRILSMPLVSPPAERSQKTLRKASSLEPGSPRGTAPRTWNVGEITTSGQMQKAYLSQEAAADRAKKLGMVDAKSLAVGGAGQGGGLGLNKPGFGPKVTHFSGSEQRGKTINISEEVPNAWAQVMDDKDPIGWVFCEYSEDGKTLELRSKGEGGLVTFKEQLGNSIAWGGFRCYGVDKRGGVECKRAKLVFVQYKPEAAAGIKKAKQSSHKGDVKDALPGAHLDVIVESPNDLNEQDLIAKLQGAAGAHKPNGYEFDEGVFVEADYYGLGIGDECKAEHSKN